MTTQPSSPKPADYITCTKCGKDAPRFDPRLLICRECRLTSLREYRARPEVKQRRREYDRKRRTPIRTSRVTGIVASTPQEYARKYQRQRRAADAVFAADRNIRTAVRNVIRRGGGKKRGKTADIIGRPLADIAAQVIKLGYKPGMHIDHITPLAVLRERYPNDERRVQREAWKACNLRVITAEQNLRKHAKREFLI